MISFPRGMPRGAVFPLAANLNLNDNISIQTGVKASNYADAAPKVGSTVIIALVASLASGTDPILGFVAFKIEAVNQGSTYIQGHFDEDVNINNASGMRGR